MNFGSSNKQRFREVLHHRPNEQSGNMPEERSPGNDEKPEI